MKLSIFILLHIEPVSVGRVNVRARNGGDRQMQNGNCEATYCGGLSYRVLYKRSDLKPVAACLRALTVEVLSYIV